MISNSNQSNPSTNSNEFNHSNPFNHSNEFGSHSSHLRLSYLKFTWMRCFRRLGKLLCGLLLLGVICAAAIYGLSFVNKSDDTAAASRFNVVFVMPKNAGLHYSLALGMVSNMESLSSMVTIKQTTSEEEARAMLDSGEVKAAVIIPEGMIHTIMSGTNDLPARILYPGEPSIETVIFRQIVDSLSQMVASSQTGVYALYEIYDDFGATEKQQDKANSQLNDLYINTVLKRDTLFSVQTVNVNDNVGSNSITNADNTTSSNSTIHSTDLVLVGYLCSGLALLFLLSGINLCFFFVAPNRAVPAALMRLGLSDSFCALADFSAATICQWLIFLVGCSLVGIIGSIMGIVPSFSIGHALVSSFVCAVFSCALAFLICRVCRGKQACMITTFAISLLVMYASGCLIPSAFLPDMLRRISAQLPGSQLKNVIFWQFGQSISVSDILLLFVEAIILVLAAILIGIYKKHKQKTPRRERSTL